MILPSSVHTIDGAKVLITADQALIGLKPLSLKENVDEAIEGTSIKHVLVAKRSDTHLVMKEGRDISLEKVIRNHICKILSDVFTLSSTKLIHRVMN